MRPFTDSRSDRVCVDRGSIAYSAVTQPRPLPLRHRGTPSVTDAAHSTRVAPNSTNTDPSAWSSQSRVITTERNSLSARPSGRPSMLTRQYLSDVENGATAGNCDVAGVRRRRLGERTVRFAPRHEVGEQQPAGAGPRRVLGRLLAGQVDVRRVVVAFEIRRLAQEHVGVAGQLDQLVADTAVGAVGQR